DVNIIQPNIFDFVTRNTADDRPEAGCCVRADDIADEHTPQLADGHSFRSAHASSQPHEDWSIADVAHGDVRNSYVFKQRPVHRLKRQSAAEVEHAIGNRNVLESAVRFRTELDSTGR